MTEPTTSQRTLLWVGSVLALVCAIWVCVWGLTGTVEGATRDRLEATLFPILFLERFFEQLRGMEAFAYFNIPVRGVAVVLLWTWAVTGIGAWLTPRMLGERSPLPLERLVFSIACGFVVLGLATLGLGVVGLARPWFISGLLLLSVAVSVPKTREIVSWLGSIVLPFRSSFRAHVGRNLLVAFVLLVLAATFLVAMTPPVQSDGLRYHLGAPQEFIKAGRIGYIPWNAFSNFPFLVDMHFMIALATGSPEASQLMHFVMALAAAGGIAAFIQRFVGPLPHHDLSPALLAACVYLATPAALVIAGWPFIDHAVSLYFLLSLYAVLLALRRSTAGTWTLVGLMIGGALGTKYTVLPHVVLLAAIALVDWVAYSPPTAARSPRTIVPRHLLLAAGVAAVVGGVWFAKSLVITGNPVYPLAHGVFRGGDWTEQSAALYQRKTEEKGVRKTPDNLIRSPAAATFHWLRYEGHFLGPVLLVSLVTAITGTAATLLRHGGRARPLAYTAVAAAAYYGVWFFSYQSNRMLLPFLALALPLSAALIRESSAVSPWLRRLAIVPFLVAIIYGGLWAVQWQYVRSPYPSTLRYLLGDISRNEYLTRAVPYYRAFQEQARLVRPGERVLLIGEHRILYAPFDAIWSDWFDTPAVLGIMREARTTSAEELLTELRRRGVRWILFNQHELSLGQPSQLEVYFRPRFTDQEWQILQDLITAKQLEQRSVPPGILLLRIPDQEPAG